MPRILIAALLAFVLSWAAANAQTPAADLQANIGRLTSLDYPTRMNAARTIRRLPSAEAVPALVGAVRKHPDEFVRYRAFIVLYSIAIAGAWIAHRQLKILPDVERPKLISLEKILTETTRLMTYRSDFRT